MSKHDVAIQIRNFTVDQLRDKQSTKVLYPTQYIVYSVNRKKRYVSNLCGKKIGLVFDFLNNSNESS